MTCTSSGSREDRWLHLVQAALRLEEGDASAAPRVADVQALLDSLLEVFPSSVDPVEDFEGYAVRKLAQALRSALR
ncbi:hypothetical protein FGE12_20530 [Aggregicoccus sp. 17bor-14]|uniref:hypothetical protein n=1 Tax=Myxococcaceae TaxID=31 RepID=UPI00129C34A6|nr:MULTISPECIES: hypothetical protein [Myxococcaceae]MBF5044797.1 hypothetical protein [Simulacricoccus sp. 17bor-14]MRI90541.1 hypothetical protein [Aggregicoccus sp. 17bor-14]